MKNIGVAVFLFILFSLNLEASGAKMENSEVALVTSLGDITIELYADKAPLTVKNFLDYVDSGFYNFTLFHRVIPGFMIQTGGLAKGLARKDTKDPVKNEASNGLSNKRGTIAMARTGDPHSATSQFFINLADNDYLDYKSQTANGYGYCVFGKVISGMDVVDKIAGVRTRTVGSYSDVPVQDVYIIKAERAKK